MGSIFFLSHQPGDSFSLPDIINIDKALHALVYTILGLAAFLALSPSLQQRHPLLSSGAVVLFCLLYGITDEFHQSFIPGRCSSGGDLIADTLGGVLAVIVWWGGQRWLPARFHVRL
jgi:VanZ family protein